MCQNFQLYNLQNPPSDVQRVRIWCKFGNSIQLRKNYSLRVLREVVDGEDAVVVGVFRKDKFVNEAHLLPAQGFVLPIKVGFFVSPRAIELDNSGLFQRVLLEFISTTAEADRALKYFLKVE